MDRQNAPLNFGLPRPKFRFRARHSQKLRPSPSFSCKGSRNPRRCTLPEPPVEGAGCSAPPEGGGEPRSPTASSDFAHPRIISADQSGVAQWLACLAHSPKVRGGHAPLNFELPRPKLRFRARHSPKICVSQASSLTQGRPEDPSCCQGRVRIRLPFLSRAVLSRSLSLFPSSFLAPARPQSQKRCKGARRRRMTGGGRET